MSISAAARRLVGRQRERQRGVHNGKAGTGVVGVAAALEPTFDLVVCDDGRVAHFAARRRDGEHYAHGHAGGRLAQALVKIPHVALVFKTVAYCLGAVDDRPAADGEQEVDPLCPCERYAFAHERKAGIGLYAAQLNKSCARRGEGVADDGEQTAALGRAAAVVEKHLFAALFGYQRGQFLQAVPAERHFGGRKILKIEH